MDLDDFTIKADGVRTQEHVLRDGFSWVAAVAEFMASQFSDTADGSSIATTRLGCDSTQVATAVHDAVTTALRQRVEKKMVQCSSTGDPANTASFENEAAGVKHGSRLSSVASAAPVSAISGRSVVSVQVAAVVVATLCAPSKLNAADRKLCAEIQPLDSIQIDPPSADITASPGALPKTFLIVGTNTTTVALRVHTRCSEVRVPCMDNSGGRCTGAES